MGTKILLTGTFDAGKTTLANLLAQVPGIHVIPEYARELLEQNRDSMREPKFQEMVLAEQLRREAAAALRPEPLVVCDRGTVDIACFSQLFGHTYDSESLLSAGRYDFIFLLSPDDIPGDRLSPRIKRSRWELEETVEWMLKEAGLPYFVLRGTPKERIRQMFYRLSERAELNGVAKAARECLGGSSSMGFQPMNPNEHGLEAHATFTKRFRLRHGYTGQEASLRGRP